MSGVDVEGVLGAHPGWHRIDEDEHGAQRIECLGLKCRERFTLRYYGDAPDAHRAHVAAVLREEIEQEIRRRIKYCGCAWCCAKIPPEQRGETHKRTCSAAQLAPSRDGLSAGGGEGS